MNRRTAQIRLQNLEILVAEAGSGLNLARKAQTSDSYLSQVWRQQPAAKGMLRNVGDELANKLEQAKNIPGPLLVGSACSSNPRFWECPYDY